MNPYLTADQVAQYLQDNPQFFERHSELLAHLSVPHPMGGRTISLTERQVLALREKSRALESRLAELIRFGEANDAIGERVHRLSIALIKAADWASALRVITRHVVEDFEVPHVAVRLWGWRGEGVEFTAVPDAARTALAALSHPYCGRASGREAATWIAAPDISSLVEIPLRKGADTVGALVLGSEEAERFYEGMGTVYLTQIGNLVSAVASRTLG